MKLVFFYIPVLSSGAQQDELNQFLEQNPNALVDKPFITDGQQSAWAICCSVPTTSNAKSDHSSTRGSGRNRIDYKEHLDPETFAKFAKLREVRNEIASEQKVPFYSLFSNAQLAEMAALDPFNRDTLATVKGIGEKRIEKYADVFAQALQNCNRAMQPSMPSCCLLVTFISASAYCHNASPLMLEPATQHCHTDNGWQRNSRNRVLRGGSWINNPRNLRAANRNHNLPDNRNDNYGFRLAGASEQYIGGSQNQLPNLFHFGGQTQGPRHVSKQRRQSPLAQNLPVDRLLTGRIPS